MVVTNSFVAVQSLNDMLSQKEALASNMMANEEKMQEMRDKYEKSLASLQEELATLQQEKDKLDIQTKSSKNSDPKCNKTPVILGNGDLH